MKIHTPIQLVISLLLVAFGMLGIPAAVSANPGTHGNGHSKFMSFFDSNNDNIVTMDELNAASIKRFTAMDTDANGRVTQDEFRNYVAKRRTEHKKHAFDGIDTNKDNQISKDEYIIYQTQKSEQRYIQMDSNKDGVITVEEFSSRKHGMHGKDHGYHRGNRIFSRLDKNDDGEVTLDESLAAWTAWFNRIDANGDQVVTTDEVQNFRDQWRHR